MGTSSSNQSTYDNRLESLLKVFLNISEIIIELDSTKKIKELNPAAKTLLNASNPSSSLDQNLVDYCEEKHLPYPQFLKKTVLNELCEEVTTQQRTANKRFQCIAWKIIPLGTKDNLNSYLLIGKDITHEKLNENALKHVEDRLSLFIDSIAGYHWWKDLEGRYLGCNHAVAKLLNLDSPEKVIGKTDYELPWADNAEIIIANDQRVIDTGKSFSSEEIIKTKNNVPLTFFVVKMPLKNDFGEIIGTIGSSIDITVLKNTQRELNASKEKAEAANEAKSKFIANMSHDIRTPMSGVIGIADILKREGTTETDREYGQIIYASAQSLLYLLNDILDVIQARDLSEDDVREDDINLETLLSNIEHLIQPNIQAKNITFISNIDPSVPAIFVSDRVKVERILLNIISNSIKFTEKGSIELNIRQLSKKGSKTLIQFKITDTGIGISKPEISKIFDLFFRAIPSHEGTYEGHGIGLFIAKKFVDTLNGKIKVASKEMKGTTFIIELPLRIKKVKIKKVRRIKESSSPKKRVITENYKLPMANSNCKQVLLIEDDALAQRTGSFYLKSVGYEVQVATDAETALKIIKAFPFDLILSDIGLPGLSGNELAVLIRHWEKVTNKLPLPIIGLSAHSSNETREESLSAGMNHVLTKPLNDEKLQEINCILNNWEKSDTNEPTSSLPTSIGKDLPATEHELFELTNYPLFDLKNGIEKAAESSELLKELLTILLKETLPIEMNLIKKYYDKRNWEEVRKIAHKLKGASLYCGTVRMQYACQYLERYILAKHSKLNKELYDQFVTVIDETEQYLHKWLNQ